MVIPMLIGGNSPESRPQFCHFMYKMEITIIVIMTTPINLWSGSLHRCVDLGTGNPDHDEKNVFMESYIYI